MSTTDMKKILKKLLPDFLLDRYARYRYDARRSPFRNKTLADTFTEIYEQQHWGNEESISGPGSSREYCTSIISGLESALTEFPIRTILDIPCGDFNWMQYVQFPAGTHYTGADIVPEIIRQNKENFESDTVHFIVKDLTTDPLERYDLVIVRDCLVHFSDEHIFQALRNIRASGSEFLLTTSFRSLTINHTIVSGDWHPINLERPPFNFPAPIRIYTENISPGYEKEHKQKSLVLWRIPDLPIN